MPHALFPVNPVTVFIGIFLLSVILYTLKELVKYAQVFWSKRTQQTNLAAQASTSKMTIHKQTDLITVEPRTKTAKHTFVRKYPKTVMAHPPEGEQEIYPTSEEIMSVTDYMKAVQVGHIKAGPNHEHIKELAKLPHAGQTKVIVLTYDANKPTAEQPKYT